MGKSIPSNRSLVSRASDIYIHSSRRPNSIPPETKHKPTWTEWFSGYFDEGHPYYHGAEHDDETDPHANEPLLGGGEAILDEIDGHLTESLLIIGLAGLLAWLVYYRQLRQHEDRQRERAQQQRSTGAAATANAAPPETPAAPQPGNQAAGQQDDQGLFPPPDDPNFNAWRAGGVGH